MNYAYALGILEARVAHRADQLQQRIESQRDRLRGDDYHTLLQEVAGLRLDVEIAKTRGTSYD